MSDDVLISSFEQLPNVLTVAVTAYLIFEDKKEKYTVCIVKSANVAVEIFFIDDS